MDLTLNFKRYFTVVMVAILTLTLSLSFTELAYGYEGGSTGGGNGDSSSSGAAGQLRWKNKSASGKWSVTNPSTDSLSGKVCAGYPKYDYGSNYFGKNIGWVTYLTSKRTGKWMNKFGLGNTFIGSWTSNYANKVGNTNSGVAFFSNSTIKKAGSYSLQGGGKIAKMKSGGIATEIHISWKDLERVVPEPHKDTIWTITYFHEDDPDGDDNNFDNRSQTARWKYENPRGQWQYYGKTDPNEFDHDNNLTAVLEEVKYTYTIKKTYVGDKLVKTEKVDEKWTVVDSKTLSQTIKYDGSKPQNGQHKFAPLNLNRNGYAQNGDGGITNDYLNGHKIDASTDNYRNITDNKDLETIDINNDFEFAFNFKNDVLGLPSEHDWKTIPKPLVNDTWEAVNGSYANGRIGDKNCLGENGMPDGSVGYYRYNILFNASINQKNNKTASLVLGSEEKVDNDSFSKEAPFRGGDWSARFIYNGDFTTDQHSQVNAWKNWWVDTYTQDRFFEYGVEYKGTITINNGYSTPTLVSNTTSPQVTQNGYAFTSDGLTQRGLYVGKVTANYAQPILYGHWHVKTLAGDVNGTGVTVN